MSQIKRDLIHGVFWSAIEKYSGLVMSIFISMVLARLLSPKEYGVVAIATVIISFLQMFCTMGVAPAIIQRDDLNKDDVNSIFTYSILIGLFFAFIFFGCSEVIADIYEEPLLIPVCKILSIQVFFAAANMVPNALMSKNKRFKELARRTLTLQIFSGLTSIYLAWKGAGVYALLVSPIFSAIGIFIWNRLYYKVTITFRLNIEPVKKIFSFSAYQFLFDFFNYFSRNFDKIIIGKYIGINPLGVYEKSYRLMQLPLNNISFVINPVLQPVLRCLQNDHEELNKKYLKLIKFVASLSFPLGVLLSESACEVIRLFYGSKWDSAIPVFEILALSLPLQMILSTSGAICLVCNNTKMQFFLGARNTITTIIGFFIAAFFFKTIVAMAWAWTLTLGINFFVSYFLLYKKVLSVAQSMFWQELIKPFSCGILVWFTLWMLNNSEFHISLIPALLLKVLLCGTLSLGFYQISKQYDFIQEIKKRINHGNLKKNKECV
ncbi:MAG: lipopolysaccharide biosynthesis protein [Fibrobacter sp.]|nr:lipopolysaccharide biosynthesis protein [Fibrobacter sp.]